MYTYLEVVCSIIADYVEARSVLRHWLHLTREQVNGGRRFGLISVADLKEALTNLSGNDKISIFLSNIRLLPNKSESKVYQKVYTYGLCYSTYS